MNTQIIDLKSSLWKQTLQKLHHDVYQLPEYVALDARRTQTTPEAFLTTDSEKIFFIPYCLRSCNNVLTSEPKIQGNFDLVSPYGYPGILLNEAAINSPDFLSCTINELKNLLQERGICSAFLRLHPILNQNFDQIFQSVDFKVDGETISVDLTLSESQIWAHTRKGHQSTINKCKRIGMSGRMVDFRHYMNEFIAIYEETMNRVGASQAYYFSRNYFENLSKLDEHIHLGIVELNNEIICASLFFESCGIVQAHLGGTKTKFLKQSPFNFLLHHVRLWAKERGNKYLHLGGGIGGSNSDSLYKFKSGFSKQRHTFLTLRLITDEEKYHYLVDLKAKALNIQPKQLLESGFFPAYRYPK